MSAYYNEIDPYAAQWLRNLIAANLIAPGEVDERSIEDVRPDELVGYTQCHFFAGIGVWSYALRLAGISDDTPLWTGSCPCQGFSVAGKGRGKNDDRHLWPVWFELIKACKPKVIFGEQVSSPIVLGKSTNENLQGLQKKLTGIGLFDTYGREVAQHLQSLQGDHSERKICDLGQSKSKGAVPSLQRYKADYAQGKLFDNSCETEGQEEGFGFQSGSIQKRDSGNNRSGGVSDYGNTLRYSCQAKLEQPFSGQDKSLCGLCSGECKGCSLFA